MSGLMPNNVSSPLDPKEHHASAAVEELKHSIRQHVVIHNAPTPELAVMLIKVIDLLEDENPARRTQEINLLAFAIVESIALYVQRGVDTRRVQAQRAGGQFPAHIVDKANNLMVMIGKSRGLPDRLAAKMAILREVAAILKALSAFTKSVFPTITDLKGDAL